jgi:glycogen synthase
VKILHVLECSIPDHGGYTIRARNIVDFQRRIGLVPTVVTSPFQPVGDPSKSVETHDGVTYYRTNHIQSPASAHSKLGSYLRRTTMLASYRRAVLEIARRIRPDIIHAHSPYTNAYACFPAARQLGLPLVYEVRTLWGETAVVEDGFRPNSWQYRLGWHFELAAMRRADMVLPIARGIRDDLVRRGAEARKLEIVGNGVDTARFRPTPPDHARLLSAGLNGCFVIGFVGSVRRIEGLSTLLDAIAICRSRMPGVRAVIVGDGAERPALEAKAAGLGLREVLFTGNVPHAEVPSWYSVMDLLVYPRIRAVVNESVTPLKPLEAMALGKVCVGSDVGGLTELIHDDQTGAIFRSDDAEDLSRVLHGLWSDAARRERLGSAALAFVRRERDWCTLVERYRTLYDSLLRANGSVMPMSRAAAPVRLV